MEEKVYFQSNATYGLAENKEFLQFFRLSSPYQMVLRLGACGFLWYLYDSIPYIGSWWLLLYCGFIIAMHTYTWFSLRNGSQGYKQSLMLNQGQDVVRVTSFMGENIRTVCPNSGNEQILQYEDLRRIAETKNLLILIFSNNLSLLVDKRTLTGGLKEQFIEYLRSRCPALKKKVQTDLFGKIAAAIYVCVVAGFLVISLLNLPAVKNLTDNLSGKIPDSASFTEIAEVLEDLGITGCTDEMLRQLDADYQSYPTYYSNAEYKTLGLLCWLGMGDYDSFTWEWKPSHNGVYWFDAEVFNIESMYTDFLTGVSALDNELDFRIIEEWTENENLHTGTGDQFVRFSWNGTEYTLQGKLDYDWFDMDVAKELSEIIRDKNTGKQLYFACDGGQGVLVFYHDAQWAKEFKQRTGISLSTNPNSIY